MAIEGPVPHNIKRVRLYEEPNGSMSVDHTGTLGDFEDVPIVEGSLEVDPGQEMIDPGTQLQSIYDYREEIPGKRTWKVAFTVPLAPTGTPAGNTVSAIQSALGKLLKIVLGGEALGTGSLADGAWSSASAGKVLVGSSLLAGMAIGWEDSDGVLHARELEEGASADLVTKVAFPATPATTHPIYASATYYLARNPQTTAQFIVEGMEDDDRWLLMGGQGTVTLALPLDGTSVPTAAFEFVGRTWAYGKDAAADLTASEIGLATYADHEPIPGHIGRLIEQDVGTATPIATVCVSAIAIAVAITNKEITCPSAPDGLLRWLRMPSRPAVSGSFTTYYADTDRFEERDARTPKYLAYQIGTEKGETILITAPKVQYATAKPVNADDVASETIEWKGRNDSDTVVTPRTDLANSPFRIHFL